jgi:hypothetical protein
MVRGGKQKRQHGTQRWIARGACIRAVAAIICGGIAAPAKLGRPPTPTHKMRAESDTVCAHPSLRVGITTPKDDIDSLPTRPGPWERFKDWIEKDAGPTDWAIVMLTGG